MTLLVLSLLFAFLSGVARGFHHARRDYAYPNKARKWMSFEQYTGGDWFNQSYPWTADHCHQMMHFQVLGLALSGMFLALASPAWWLAIVWVWLVWFIEGRGFTLFYHVILPDSPSVPQYSFWTWVIGWVRFWD